MLHLLVIINMASFSDAYEFRKAIIEDATAITLLEDNSYPPDEAATPAKISYRIEHANDFFYILKKNHQLIGFINGTVINEDTIHHESMSVHHPTGKTLVIHSVVVDKEYRRQKTASKMLQSYIQKIYELKSIDQILLLSKSNLLPFYLSNNFRFIKISPVVHGQETWMELGIHLNEHYATPQWIVDAFASEPFTGNQAAVVLTHKEDDWMQKIATENNYAETSFVQHVEDNIFKLRW